MKMPKVNWTLTIVATVAILVLLNVGNLGTNRGGNGGGSGEPPPVLAQDFDYMDPSTYPDPPASWSFLADTHDWIRAHPPDGYPLISREFDEWKWGMNSAQMDYLQYLENPDAPNYQKKTSLGADYQAISPAKEAWKAYYRDRLTNDQIVEAENAIGEDPLFWTHAKEYRYRVGDELAMKAGLRNAKPQSPYYRDLWYVYYRYCPPNLETAKLAGVPLPGALFRFLFG